MAKPKKKPVKRVKHPPTPRLRRTRKKRVIGVFKDRKVKGKTELRRWQGDNKKGKAPGTVKSVSLILYNKRRKDDKDNLEKFASDIENDRKGFYKQLDTVFYRAKDKKGNTILPFTCVVIVEQRDRRDYRQFHYEAYFMQPPATKDNVFKHTYNTVRNHSEFIRTRIKRMGYTDVKYDFSNFWPWYVPSIRIELLYE
jgi:hypothetical protein